MFNNVHRFLFAVLLLTVLAPAAHATYIDPGSGSIVLQALLAVVFGAAVTIRCFWQRIKAALFGAPKNEKKDSQ